MQIQEGAYVDCYGTQVVEISYYYEQKDAVGIRVGAVQFSLTLTSPKEVWEAVQDERLIYLGSIEGKYETRKSKKS